MKARRFVAVAAFALSVCVATPAAFAGNGDEPWSISPDSCSMSLLDAAVAGVNAALTVL